MNPIQLLVKHNIACLEQGRSLLARISDEQYRQTRPPIYESSIGDHMRHTLEHYLSFAAGYADGAIDYDARARDVRLASDRNYALEIIGSLTKRLREITTDRPLTVKMDCSGTDGEPAIWSTSSGVRDLQYLQAHTIHHFALIALILRLQGVAVPDDFGVAPSTLAYRRKQQLMTDA